MIHKMCLNSALRDPPWASYLVILYFPNSKWINKSYALEQEYSVHVNYQYSVCSASLCSCANYIKWTAAVGQLESFILNCPRGWKMLIEVCAVNGSRAWLQDVSRSLGSRWRSTPDLSWVPKSRCLSLSISWGLSSPLNCNCIQQSSSLFSHKCSLFPQVPKSGKEMVLDGNHLQVRYFSGWVEDLFIRFTEIGGKCSSRFLCKLALRSFNGKGMSGHHLCY